MRRVMAGRPVDPLALHPVHGVAVQVDLDPWLSLSGLAGYSGLCVRTLRALLRHPSRPLPHYRVGAPGAPGKRGAKVLVRRSEFDGWMGQWRQRQTAQPRDLDGILEAAVASLGGRRGRGGKFGVSGRSATKP